MSSKKLWGTAAFAAITHLYSMARAFISSLSSLSFLLRRFLILECFLVFVMKAKQLKTIWTTQQTTFSKKCLDSTLPSLYFLAIIVANIAFLSGCWLLAAILLTGSSVIAFLELRLQLKADYQCWLKNKTQLNTEKLRFSYQESLYALCFTLAIVCAYFIPGCALIAGGLYLCLLGLSAFNAAWWAYHWRKTPDTPLDSPEPSEEAVSLGYVEVGVLNLFQICAARSSERLPLNTHPHHIKPRVAECTWTP